MVSTGIADHDQTLPARINRHLPEDDLPRQLQPPHHLQAD
jgi:hypothetical protein